MLKIVITQGDFFHSIRTGDCERVSQLVLQYGTHTDVNGYTPLMVAIVSKQESVLPLLVPSSSGFTTPGGDYAITMAAELEFLPGVLATLPYEHQYRNSDGESALHILARKNNAAIVPECSKYLERARDSLGRLPVDVAAERGHVEFLKTAIASKLGLTYDDLLRTFCAARHAGKQEIMDCLREYIFVEPVECLCYRCSNPLDMSGASLSLVSTPIMSRYSSICRTPVSVLSLRSQDRLSGRRQSLRSPCLSPHFDTHVENVSVGMQVAVPCEGCAELTQMYEERIQDLNSKLLELTMKLERANAVVSQTASRVPVNSVHNNGGGSNGSDRVTNTTSPVGTVGTTSTNQKPRARSIVEAASLSLSPLEKSTRPREHILIATPTVRQLTYAKEVEQVIEQVVESPKPAPALSSRSSDDIALRPSVVLSSSSKASSTAQPAVLHFSGFQDITDLAASRIASVSDSRQDRSDAPTASQHVDDLGSMYQAPNMHSNITDLMRAACSGNIGLLSKLLTIQARKQTDSGFTALMFACKIGNIAAAKLLVPYEIGMQTYDGSTALMEACSNGNRDLAELVISEQGLYRKDGWSALMSAARAGLPAIVSRLLPVEGGRATTSGITALMKAVEQGHYSCVSLLLPTEVYLLRKDGKTALDIAYMVNNTGLIGLMESFIKNNPPQALRKSLVNSTASTKSRNMMLTESEMALLNEMDGNLDLGGSIIAGLI